MRQTPASALRNIRRTRTMSQRDLARLVGVTQKTISEAERGITRPRPDLQVRIAAVLGAPQSELFPFILEVSMKKYLVSLAIVCSVLSVTPRLSARACFVGDDSCVDTQSSDTQGTGSEWDLAARAAMAWLILITLGML